MAPRPAEGVLNQQRIHTTARSPPPVGAGDRCANSAMVVGFEAEGRTLFTPFVPAKFLNLRYRLWPITHYPQAGPFPPQGEHCLWSHGQRFYRSAGPAHEGRPDPGLSVFIHSKRTCPKNGAGPFLRPETRDQRHREAQPPGSQKAAVFAAAFYPSFLFSTPKILLYLPYSVPSGTCSSWDSCFQVFSLRNTWSSSCCSFSGRAWNAFRTRCRSSRSA